MISNVDKTDEQDRPIVVIGNGESEGNAGVTSEYRLKVDTVVSVPASWKNTTVYEDMTANSGVVIDQAITNAAWVTVYNYDGEGMLSGFVLGLETMSDNWLIRLSIDSNQVFSSAGINTTTLEANNRYGYDDDSARHIVKALGIDLRNDVVRFEFPYFPCRFSTNVKIEIRRNTGAGNKKFRAGLVLIQKGI